MSEVQLSLFNESQPMLPRSEQRKQNRLRRNEQIRQDFKDLYETQRLRLDDCITNLANKYFLAEATIQDILFKK